MKRDKKKQKPEEEEEEEEKKKMEVEVVVEGDALAAAAMVAAAAALEDEEELWRMRLKAGDDVFDEMMTSWNTVWFPSCWDVEFVEKNYGVLFSDVVWDDDLWDLKTSTQLPPLDNIRQD